MIGPNKMRATSKRLVATIALALAVGCGGSGEEIEFADRATCVGAWQPIISRQPGLLGPEPLLVSDGMLYFGNWASTIDTAGMEALPSTGGTRRLLTPTSPKAIWPDGDRLLVPDYEGISSVVRSTGERTVIYKEPPRDGNTLPPIRVGYALDESFFYWTTYSIGQPTNIWRLPRRGGTPEKLAELPDDYLFDSMSAGTTHLATYSRGGDNHAYSIPKTGGEARQLETGRLSARLIGSDGVDVLWTDTGERVGDISVRYELWLTPIAGGTARKMGKLPLDMAPVWGAPDGIGGWVLVAYERFSNQVIYVSVWTIDAAGIGKRLACQPSDNSYLSTASLGPDALYLSMSPKDAGLGWSFVRVAR